MAKKTILAIIQQATAELNLPSPVIVLSNQDQNVQKLLSLTRAVCDDLLAEADWQTLQTRYSFTTVSGQESYLMPGDLGRFISGSFFDANNRWPMQGPKTPIEWEWIKVSSFGGGPFAKFRVYNDKFFVSPLPGVTPYTFNFEYISSYYVRNGANVAIADFIADDNICQFDHRLLVYGMKLKWRESLGLDTTAVLSDYKRALEFAKGADMPTPKLNLLGSTGFRVLSAANLPDGSWS